MADIEKTLDDLKLLNALCHGTVLDDAIALLKEQEAVVRCKDCEKHNSWGCWQYFIGRVKISDNWFCADGRRKSD